MWRSAEEWEKHIGSRAKRARLDANLTQDEVASRCGISAPTVANLEAGRGSTLSTLVKVMQVLGADGQLEALFPEAPISPIQVKQHGRVRRRASGVRSHKSSGEER